LDYMCSEYGQSTKLLKKINDETVYYRNSEDDSDTYIYMLKDRQHIIEMSDVPDKSIGYAYRYKYRPVESFDLASLKKSKATDEFPKTDAERLKLEYRYARVDSYNNPTTIQLNAGDKVNIEAGGTITLGSFAGDGGPEGIDGYKAYCSVPEFRHGSLLFRTGKGDWDAAGTEKTFTATSSGLLEFMVNDSDPSNNIGSFWVSIKIIRSR
jgi:hypothetical protein